jgi:hypothetical protein
MLYEKPQVKSRPEDAASKAGQEDLSGEIGIDPGHDEETADVRYKEGNGQARQEHDGKEYMVPTCAQDGIKKSTKRTCNNEG